MEPVSLIVTALTAGAVAAAKDTAEKGVKDLIFNSTHPLTSQIRFSSPHYCLRPGHQKGAISSLKMP
ncbi:hypothetical protein [Microcystis aeruginosa]|uniref:Uncharacterized protein n=1 Tax=Microcystis aeruginosa Ma_QC_C_20070703_M131 TaxID=2486263 RepID=A0A551YDG2_MICAE|nr:hypothetical protein [Microcystis aeruginosa]MDB9390926.1 hypothetical protein [Microcystis aeruginosa CS-579]TRT58990.1 MAG: hypothetical protein EWV85_05480 [Microcystis aeruginosa Ma_QC_C_20070703_M131]